MTEKGTQPSLRPEKPIQAKPIPTKEKVEVDIVDEEIIENNINENPKGKPNKKPKLGFSVGIQDKIGEPLQVNLKQICNCYAFALMKHVIFSKEKDMLNEIGMEPQDIQNNDLLKICVKEQLDFPKSPAHPTKSDKLNDIFEQSFNGIAHELPITTNEKHSNQRKNSGCDLSYSNSHVEEPYKSIPHNLANKEKQASELNEENKEMLKLKPMGEQDSELVNIQEEEDLLMNNELELSLESHYQAPDKHAPTDYSNYIRESVSIFKQAFNFATNQFDPIDCETPDERIIYKYTKKIMIKSKMEKEIPIIALLYLEKIMLKTGILINSSNWKRFALIALVIGSKIWDDDSFENVHFTKVMPELLLREVNELERVFLELLDYKLFITASEYAKYYFILRTYSEYIKKEKFEIEPIKQGRLSKLQKGIGMIENKLREQYNLEQTI